MLIGGLLKVTVHRSGRVRSVLNYQLARKTGRRIAGFAHFCLFVR